MATISVPASDALPIVSGLERVVERLYEFLDSASRNAIAAEQLAEAEGLGGYLGDRDRGRVARVVDAIDERVLDAFEKLADEMRHVEVPPLREAATAARDLLDELSRRTAELQRELAGGDDAS